MAGTDKTPSQLSQIVKLLTEISGSVAGMIAYYLAITARMKTPFPYTAALLTLLTTVIVLWAWRWPQISQKAAGRRNSATPKTKKRQTESTFERWVDPLRSTSGNTYLMSLARRRIEVGLMSVLALVAGGRSVSMIPNVVQEFHPSPYSGLESPCNQAKEPDVRRAVIANFYETSANEIAFEDRLRDEMRKKVQGDNVQICQDSVVVQNSDEARTRAAQIQADVFIWGRSDKQGVDVNIEVTGWEELSKVWTFQAGQNDLQMSETSHFSFLTQYIFNLFRYLNAQYAQAREDLESAIAGAAGQSWLQEPGNRKDLAYPYYIVALSYAVDETIPETVRYEAARKNYDHAIENDPDLVPAIFNRGQICILLKDRECAMADFTRLIERRPRLSASFLATVYTSRAELQPPGLAEQDLAEAIRLDPREGYPERARTRLDRGDLRGAIADFEESLKLMPEDPDLYHSLGQAQLLAGDFDGAVKTYQTLLPYLPDEETRDTYVEDLNDLTPPAGAEDAFQETVDRIVQILGSARIP